MSVALQCTLLELLLLIKWGNDTLAPADTHLALCDYTLEFIQPPLASLPNSGDISVYHHSKMHNVLRIGLQNL